MNGKRHRPEQIVHKRRQYENSAGLGNFIWDGENILLQTDSGGTTNRDYTWVREGGGERWRRRLRQQATEATEGNR